MIEGFLGEKGRMKVVLIRRIGGMGIRRIVCVLLRIWGWCLDGRRI
jgi:hypothetical protein